MFTKKFFENNIDGFNAQIETISDVDSISVDDFENAEISMYTDNDTTDATVCRIGGIELYAVHDYGNLFIWVVIDDIETGKQYKSDGMLYQHYQIAEGESTEGGK